MKKRWVYEPDEKPKKKHAWRKRHAGFIVIAGRKVGKCPRDLTTKLAEDLIKQGVEVRPKRSAQAYPARIYVVHGGVLYRAVPTIPGRSYHGFPELPEKFNELPIADRRRVLEHAEALGQLREVKRWLGAQS